MTDFVKEMTDAWDKEGIQVAYDRGNILLGKIAEEVRRLHGQRTTITALMQHLEAAGAQHSRQITLFKSVKAPDRPKAILEAAEAVLDSTSGISVVQVQDVLAELDRRHLDLGVKQPLAVIGTVLSRSEYYPEDRAKLIPPHRTTTDFAT